MGENNLKEKAASGMAWTTIQKFAEMGIRFVSGIVLARLLTPYDYGCIGMLAIFMTLTESFIDGGFGSALIQKKRPTQVDYSTIFWWNVILAVLMYMVLYFSAPFISQFYRIPLLCDILRVQGLILFIYALNLIQRNQLRKQFKFRILSIVRIITSAFALIIGIIMAYKGLGVWSLVAMNMIEAAIPAIIFWGYTKWKPTWIFSWKSFHELFSFGIYMFLTHVTSKLISQFQGLLIGRLFNPTTLGLYSKASGTESLASKTISSVMTSVTYPLYAEVQDDKDRMQNMIKRLTMTISYITFPALFILLLCAKPIFILLYSDRWVDSVPFFQVLCIAGLAICLQSVNLQTISAIGKSKTMFKWSIIKQIVAIILIVSGLYLFGMKGLLVAVVMGAWFTLFVNIGLVSKHIGYRWYKQIGDLLPVTVSSVACAILSYIIGSFLNLDLYPDGIVKFLIYVSLYVGWSLIFKPEAYTYTLSILPLDRIKKKFVKK
ncbi:MAG: lipopolysaccharide biosynthesis protein [Prevotella sp.]|nr:lipopolysaccharide biosynthesis protein [Prevotella sp.]